MTAGIPSNKIPRTPTERVKHRIEIVNTIMLAVSTLAITWCSYQGTLWGGIQTFKLSDSGKWARKSSEKLLSALQHHSMDEAIMIKFVEDVIEHRNDHINFYLPRVRPEFRKALEAWLESKPLENPNGPPHPMATKEYQQIIAKNQRVVDEYTRNSDVTYILANQANMHSDRYVLLSVIFSLVLFLGAIATNIENIWMSLSVTLLSLLVYIISLYILLTVMPRAYE